ncbi:hypothetical protein A0J61_09872 [Choanephora cucurbitarum]|uniref:Uncharacterized protein n=1 Tax=Choanephora cucurbitarum TaxID=101091 RepID=A0A1C7MZ38_9FUNG|nr:hypothetical protein A0J61_09872 [Choanephora cucurbitarum]
MVDFESLDEAVRLRYPADSSPFSRHRIPVFKARVSTCSEYKDRLRIKFDSILDRFPFKTKEQRKIVQTLGNDEHWDAVDYGLLNAKFIYSSFIAMNTLFSQPISLEANESMFNHMAIWPILSLAIDDRTSFLPGEIELSASSKNYNADALIKYGEVEVCVLETSGRYKLEDNARFGYDHVKGAFALLSMIKAIYKKYRFATKETAVELRVHFVHARGTKMHLWSLEAPFENTFVIQRVASTEIPATASDSSSILSLCSFA